MSQHDQTSLSRFAPTLKAHIGSKIDLNTPQAVFLQIPPGNIIYTYFEYFSVIALYFSISSAGRFILCCARISSGSLYISAYLHFKNAI